MITCLLIIFGWIAFYAAFAIHVLKDAKRQREEIKRCADELRLKTVYLEQRKPGYIEGLEG